MRIRIRIRNPVNVKILEWNVKKSAIRLYVCSTTLSSLLTLLVWTSTIFHTSQILLFLTPTYIHQNLTRVVLPPCGEFSFLFGFLWVPPPPMPNLINADEAVTTPQSTCLQMVGPRWVRPYLVPSTYIPASIHHNNLSSSLIRCYMFIISLLLVSHHFSFWLVIIWMVTTFPPSGWLSTGWSSLSPLLIG